VIDWLLTTKAGLFTGTAVIWALIIVGFVWLIWKFGDVRPGPAPVFPKPLNDATTVVFEIAPAPPNYRPSDDWYPLAGYLTRAIDATAEAVTEVIEAVDPLTVELETVDPSVPLFYEIKRPKPFDPEGFTVGWTRERIAEVIANGRPQ
jgi:hypothetical protein